MLFTTWELFNDLFDLAPNVPTQGKSKFKDGKWEMSMNVPGYKSKDFEITYGEGLLSIKWAQNRRQFDLSYLELDPETIAAKVEDGVLTIAGTQVPKNNKVIKVQ